MTMLGKILLSLVWMALSVATVLTGYLVIDSHVFDTIATVLLLVLLFAVWAALTFAFLMAMEV